VKEMAFNKSHMTQSCKEHFYLSTMLLNRSIDISFMVCCDNQADMENFLQEVRYNHTQQSAFSANGAREAGIANPTHELQMRKLLSAHAAYEAISQKVIDEAVPPEGRILLMILWYYVDCIL
jgi:hypothetical protein